MSLQDHGKWELYLNLINNIESVVVSAVRKDNAIQRDRHTIRRGSRASRPSILEVRFRTLDGRCSTQYHKAGDNDEEQSADLNDADAVREPVSILGVEDQSLSTC